MRFNSVYPPTHLIKILFLFLIFLVMPFAAHAQFEEYSHPELNWQTFETEHFIVHFHQGTKRTAFVAAKIIEDIYPAVTDLYDYKPPKKIHLVIKDTDDYSNGAAYFFNNKMEIWATNLDYVMRGTKNWLRDVITHEFTHMVSIQKTVKSSLSFPYGFFQWFGYENERRKDVVRGFPNLLISYPLSSINMPVWFAEGVAQQQSDAARFDYRDPHREMIIRDRILNEQLLTYNQMNVFGKTSHGNESSYNLGFSFSKYLAKRFGEKIFSDITAISSKWSSYTFEGALQEATGVETDVLYANWKDSLTSVYLNRTRVIRENEIKGRLIEKQGFSNLYPSFSPDGSKIAYLTNKGNDYFSQNSLVVRNLKTGKTKELAGPVSSSLSWSPDGRYIAHAGKKENDDKSSRNELGVYDLEKGKLLVFSENLRGNNPDFSNDGKKLVFVSSTNGLHQLNVYELPQDFETEDKLECAFDIETGQYSSAFTNAKKQRKVTLQGGKITQLLAFQDGRQIYHPRWSNDDKKIVFDTSVEYGRNIGVYDIESGTFELMLEAEEELRYPTFQKGTDWLYYSASTTGIYNLYRYNLKTGIKELLTNVTGGAFMPSVSAGGNIAFALYDSIGYKISLLENPEPVDLKLAEYNKNYLKSIPDKNFDDSELPEFDTRSYKQSFTSILWLPRIYIDYETIKPGIYALSSDVLDKTGLILGGAVNSDFDYDLYGYIYNRSLGPTIFAEAFNINANIKDTLEIDRGYIARGVRNVNFNLLQFGVGAGFIPYQNTNVTLGYIRSLYSAKLDPVVIKTPIDGTFEIPTIRYDYLRGHAFEAKMSIDAINLDRFKNISPSGGFYFFTRLRHESNDFLEGFSTDRQLGLEDFKNYTFNSIEINGEYYLKNPLIKSHALGLKLKGGYIDRPVDDFFNFFAGGLIGLKGYPFYSIEGRQTLIGGMTYRFPLHTNLDLKLGHLQFDKLYAGVFYEYGNAFNEDFVDLDKFKRDIGFELRLDSFSYNLFPTRVFFQAAWPIDEIKNGDTKYPKEWRFYAGVLFDFDLRERFNSLLGGQNSALGSLKFW